MKSVKIRPKDLEKVRLAIMKIQGNACALCLHEFKPGGKRPAMDHDHKTGFIRGVLCLYCNGMLGKAENASRKAVGKNGDSLAWIKRMMEYLMLHSNPQWAVPGVRRGLIYPTHKTAEDIRLARLKRAKEKRKQAAVLKKVK